MVEVGNAVGIFYQPLGGAIRAVSSYKGPVSKLLLNKSLPSMDLLSKPPPIAGAVLEERLLLSL